MELTVIIINYNVKYFLEQCLYSVRKAIRNISAEIIVVDNASSDGSLEYLQPAFPLARFISNPVNTGFAKANNKAWKEATGKHILFLNPDTILSEDCLEKCIAFLDSHPDAGACGVRMLDGNGRFLPESKRAFPSPATAFYKLAGLTALFPRSRLLARYYLGHLSEEHDQEVDVLAGAFFIVRKHLLEQTGGFDEQFFMYGEDIDLSYRIQESGYKNYYLAAPVIIHFKGESTKKGDLNYVTLFYKAMAIFVKKHYKPGGSFGFGFLLQVSIWFRAGLAAIGNMLRKKQAVAKVPLSIKTAIIGADVEANEAASIINKQKQSCREVLRIEPTTDINERVMAVRPDEIVFCEGTFSYKAIIGLMNDLPKSISFKIHSSGSNSIVGSDSKHTSGSVLA